MVVVKFGCDEPSYVMDPYFSFVAQLTESGMSISPDCFKPNRSNLLVRICVVSCKNLNFLYLKTHSLYRLLEPHYCDIWLKTFDLAYVNLTVGRSRSMSVWAKLPR